MFCFVCVDVGKAVDMLGVCVFLGVFWCCSLQTTVLSLTDNTNKVIKYVCLLISIPTAGNKVIKSLSKAFFSDFWLKRKKKKKAFVV